MIGINDLVDLVEFAPLAAASGIEKDPEIIEIEIPAAVEHHPVYPRRLVISRSIVTVAPEKIATRFHTVKYLFLVA